MGWLDEMSRDETVRLVRLIRLTSHCFRALGFGGGDLIKYPLCGMNFTELSACVHSAKWL